MLLFSYLWLIILAEYFYLLLLHTFSFRCWWKWETTQKLKSINNKYFMCVTINKMTKGNIVFGIPVRRNYTKTRQYVQSKCEITNWYFKRLWTCSLLYYIYQELSLSTNTVVLKQGKLQHAAVYIIKFRMTSIKTEYLMTCILQNIPA